jgi:hypothetical protein
MKVLWIALTASLVAGLPSSARAQEAVDVDRLPLSLERIQSELKDLAGRPDVGLFHVHYYVDVYGRPPLIELFSKEDSLTAPVPYGGPTHKEMLQVMTPKEYRAPVMDFTALARWLGEQLSKKSDHR